jgi:hypothetical protein
VTIALFYMTNPLWQFIIGPLALVGFGWWLRGRCSDPDPLGPYDWADEEDFG